MAALSGLGGGLGRLGAGGRDGSSRGVSIMGVPARIMAPRLVLIVSTLALVCLGIVMIFSASSVEAISEMGDAAYYVKRQAMFAGIGLLLAIACAKIDYHWLAGRLFVPVWAGTVLLLLAVYFLGDETNGATRWVMVGPMRLQPSEFAKVTLAIAAAKVVNDFFGERTIDMPTMILRGSVYIGVPMALIFIQPDKGTTGIIVVMVLAVAVSAGVDTRPISRIALAALVVGLIASLATEYSRQRILTVLDPWSDPYGTGYQLTRGFMAFGSGGVFGLGLGMSRMKYSYLPEAHNDFIFAVIGEELGLVGTLAVVALFAALLWAILRVSRNASDFLGRLVAVAVAALIAAQFFLNAMGVLALFPLSGKPMPFLSYGGSSIMSCLMLVGLAVNVSLGSSLPETVHDVRRRSMTLAEEEDTGVGEPHVHAGTHDAAPLATATGASRSGSTASRSVPLASPEEARRGLRLVDGGSSASGALGRAERGSADGRGRIDLGPSASERLRPSSGPTVRRGRGSFPSGRGGSVGAARSGRPGTSRGASDRFSNGGARPSRPRRRG